MVLPIEAIYENGVFRPLQPVELPEGARVAVVTFTPQAPLDQAASRLGMPEPLVGEELMALLTHIDSLPLAGAPDPDLSTTYREILYPRHSERP